MKSAAVAPSAADYYGDNDHYNDALKKCSLFSMPMKTYIYHSNAEMSVFYCIFTCDSTSDEKPER